MKFCKMRVMRDAINMPTCISNLKTENDANLSEEAGEKKITFKNIFTLLFTTVNYSSLALCTYILNPILTLHNNVVGATSSSKSFFAAITGF